MAPQQRSGLLPCRAAVAGAAPTGLRLGGALLFLLLCVLAPGSCVEATLRWHQASEQQQQHSQGKQQHSLRSHHGLGGPRLKAGRGATSAGGSRRAEEPAQLILHSSTSGLAHVRSEHTSPSSSSSSHVRVRRSSSSATLETTVSPAAGRALQSSSSSSSSAQQEGGKGQLPSLLRRPSYMPGGIPRIMHQMFLPDAEALRKQEAVPLGNFRRDWRRSCQVHNPGWRYVLWDTAMCEKLLGERYPWFLETFRAMDSMVVKSDAMRPFILHAYGGAYLDMDIECFGPLEEVFSGHSLVLQAQEPKIINNGQMASVAGHPLWPLMQQRAGVKCKETIGKRLDAEVVMQAVGPWALTEEFRKYMSLESAPALPGQYPDAGWASSPLNNCSAPGAHCVDGRPPPTTVQVYSPKQWFEACTWDDLGCQQGFAECAPFLRAFNTERALAGLHLPPALPQPSTLMTRIKQVAPSPYTDEANKVLTNEERRQLTRCFLTWGNLSGVHQFSGSWMATGSAKGLEHKAKLVVMASQGLAKFLRTPDYFVELQLPSSPAASAATTAARSRALQQQGGSVAATTLASGSTRTLDADPMSSTATTTTSTMGAGGAAAGGGGKGPARLHPALAQAPGWLAQALAPVHALQPGGAGCHVVTAVLFGAAAAGCCPHSQQPEFQAQTLRELAQWTAASRCSLSVLTDAKPDAQPVLAEVASLAGVSVKHLDLALLAAQALAQAQAQAQSPAAGTKARGSAAGSGAGGGGAGGKNAQQQAAAVAGMSRQERDSLGLRAALVATLRTWKLKRTSSARLTLLHVSGSGPLVWGVLRQLNVVGGRALVDARPHVVLLDAGPLPAANQSLLQPAYQHLYQEQGLLGHMHQAINATTHPEACMACIERLPPPDEQGAAAGEPPVLPALRLGLTSLPRVHHRPASSSAARKARAQAARA